MFLITWESMSGDFNPDEVIAKIDKTFGQMQTRPFQKYRKTKLPSAPIIKKLDQMLRTIGLDYQETKTKMFY
jgi:predicted Zn-dependent peptidase